MNVMLTNLRFHLHRYFSYPRHFQGRFICSSIVSSTKEETIDINTTTSTSHETMLQQMLDNKTVHGDREAGVVNTRQDISPGNSIFLRCSLNVWHAVNYDTNSLNHALYDLLESATNLFEEQWLVVSVTKPSFNFRNQTYRKPLIL